MNHTTLLIIDDEKDMLDGLKRILPYELENIAIKVSTSPLKALQLMRRNSFDLVLMDVRMPEMDGLDLLEQARKLDPHMTIIMMT
ncbi:MAG: response regulator, partial [Desulfonatronovibrio sp.]